MTYLEYLLLFIVFPSLIILILLIGSKGQYPIPKMILIISIVSLSVIAFVYTTPWDNYLVANSIWTYNSSKIIGIIFGYVPFEEYMFFILETVFVSLFFSLFIQLRLIEIPEESSIHFSQTKILILLFLSLIWIISLITFIMGFNRLLYFNLLVLWAIPPIFLQLFIGWDVISYNKSKIGIIVLVLGSYLSITDAYAINTGIWSISKEFTTGIIFYGLPLEEMLFFFSTVMLIIFGQLLIRFFSEKWLISSFKNNTKFKVTSNYSVF